jgi:hypothetical protein
MILGLVAVVILVVAGGLAAAFLTAGGGQQPAAQANLGPAQQTQLERGLTAPAITKEATVVAVEIRGQFLAKGRRLLPAGSRILVLPSTFEATSPRTATVRATVSGPQPGHWLLLLIKEGKSWLLIGTRRLP